MGYSEKVEILLYYYHLSPKRNGYNMYTEKEDFMTKDE